MAIYNYVNDGYVNAGYLATVTTNTDAVSVVSMRQYDSSPIIQGILNNWAANLYSAGILDTIYDTCVNIQTCTGHWLDLWAVKVGVSRYVQIPSQETSFGFNESGNDWLPFNDGCFYLSSSTQTYALTDVALSSLILSKSAANITNCTANSINNWLNISYGSRGNCYCIDNHDMTATYYFNFALAVWEITILTQSTVLPRPVGVQVTLNVLGVNYSVN